MIKIVLLKFFTHFNVYIYKEGIFAISESDEQKGLLMGLKRFTKYAEYPNPIELRKTIAKSVINSNSYSW